MPQTFEQEFLKPGRYHLGGGRFATLTSQDISSYVEGTKGLIKAGYAPPVIFAHAEPGSEDGAPRNPRDKKAAEVRNGAGWLKDVKIGSDGAAVHVLDIRDKTAINGLKNGSIKFTSPELRDSWTDGKGVIHKHVIAHVALTHKPRNPDQGEVKPLTEVLASTLPNAQFSLDDLIDDSAITVPNQFADDDEVPSEGEGDQKPADEVPGDPEPKNPDLEDGAPTEDEQQLEAVTVLLQDCCQLALPADTSMKTLVRDLLTALKTKQAVEAASKADESEPEDDEDDDAPAEPLEERSVLQYSLDDAEAGIAAHPIVGRVIKHEGEKLSRLWGTMLADGRVTPALRDKLFRTGIKQFSADGDELPVLTLSEVTEALNDSMISGSVWTGDQIVQMGEEIAQDESQWSAEEGPQTPEEVKAFNDRMTEKLSVYAKR